MQVMGGYLRTTVGRRLFASFLLAAFLPALLTAALAHWYVKGQLRDEIEARVSRSAKLAGLQALGSLVRLETSLGEMGAPAGSGGAAGLVPAPAPPARF